MERFSTWQFTLGNIKVRCARKWHCFALSPSQRLSDKGYETWLAAKIKKFDTDSNFGSYLPGILGPFQRVHCSSFGLLMVNAFDSGTKCLFATQ